MSSLAKHFQVAALCALTSVLIFAQSVAPAVPASGTYKVVLNRPFAKGDTYKLSVDVKVRSESTMGIDGAGGAQGGIEEGSGSLSGTVRVMDVNAIGEPTIFMIHVEKAESKTGDKPDPVKLAGVDVGISFPSGKPRYVRRDSQPINKDEEMLLSMAFTPPRGISPDEILGPGKEVKPGDTWSVSKEALAKEISGDVKDPKKAMDPSRIDGTVTFVGTEAWEGLPCLHLTAKVAIKNPENPHFVGEASLEFKQDMLVPLDPSVKKSKDTSDQLSDVRGKYITDDGKKLDIKNKSHTTIQTAIQ
jgi:hypothetical protein